MSKKTALLVVDMQKDFMPGGALAVPNADKTIFIINRALNSSLYNFRIACKDAHPKDHISFQKWPEHCVKGTEGYEFAEGIEADKFDFIVEKGSLPQLDSYSAFYNAPEQPNELLSFLKDNKITDLYICGVALEYCVKETAMDALGFNFKVFLPKAKIRAIDHDKADEVYRELADKGVTLL